MEVIQARRGSPPFVPFRGGVTTTSGKLLAINPNSVAAIFSMWDKDHNEHVLVLLLNNNSRIKIREDEAPAALEDLGLEDYADSWVLNLAEDID